MAIQSEGRGVETAGREGLQARQTVALIRTGAAPASLPALTLDGERPGFAVQNVDDILDLEENFEALGKPAERDRRKKAATFSAFHGLPASSAGGPGADGRGQRRARPSGPVRQAARASGRLPEGATGMRPLAAPGRLVPLLATLALVIGLEAGGQPPQEYAADQVMRSREGTIAGKIAVGPDRYRLELALEGQRQVMIARFDKRVIWMLMPEERMYLEMPLVIEAREALSGRDPAQRVERQLVGTETVGGHPTRKYRVTVTGKDGTYVGYQWLAQDLGELPIRWEDEQGTGSVELRNIEVGRQPAELFEVPAGFQKLAMPGGLPGMPGGQRPPGMPKR